MARFSKLCCLRVKSTRPHGSFVFGSRAAMFTAAGEKSAGAIRLLASNGARSATVRPPLHAGDVIAEKSPASIWPVGSNAIARVDRRAQRNGPSAVARRRRNRREITGQHLARGHECEERARRDINARSLISAKVEQL